MLSNHYESYEYISRYSITIYYANDEVFLIFYSSAIENLHVKKIISWEPFIKQEPIEGHRRGHT